MPSGRFTRLAAFAALGVACVSAGLWLAPRVRSDGRASAGASTASPDAYRAEPGTALLHVLPPRDAPRDVPRDVPAAGGSDTWHRMIATHAARIARPEVFAEVVGDPAGAAAKTRWHAPRGSAQHAGAVEGLRRATSVRVVPGTSVIAVRVDVDPPADAVALTNEICFQYIKACKDGDVRAFQDRVKLLGRELAMVKIELDTEVSPLILNIEKDLGGDAVSTISEFNAKQGLITHLLEDRARLASALAEQQARAKSLAKHLEEGKVPAAIRGRVREHPEWLRASERLADAEAELETAKAVASPDAKAVASREKQRDVRRERLDRLHKDLGTELGEVERDEALRRELELQAQAQQVDKHLGELSTRMGELNQKLGEYRTLKDQERELRDRMKVLQREMTHINQFEINTPFTSVEWAQRATPGP